MQIKNLNFIPRLWFDDNNDVCVTVVTGTFGSLLHGSKNNAFFRHKDANSNVGWGIA